MNVLALGARVIGPSLAVELVRTFLARAVLAARSGTAGASRRSKQSRLEGNSRRRRQLDAERAPDVGLAAHADVSAEQLRESSGDAQPQPAATDPARRRLLDLPERSKMCSRSSRSIPMPVSRTSNTMCHVRERADDDVAARRELHRVRQQVDEHLPQLAASVRT